MNSFLELIVIKMVLRRKSQPKIAMLNIGTEQDKGKPYINETANLLKKSYLSKNFMACIRLNGSDKFFPCIDSLGP